MIDYKNLWFELCEEKKQLQLENITLKINYEYICEQFENLEKLHSKLIQYNWNESGVN